MLTDEDIADRAALRSLFEKRRLNRATKEGFFHFEDQDFVVAQGRETFIAIAHDIAVALPLFLDGELDFHKFDKAMELLREAGTGPIDTLWDVGANIGSICIPALARGIIERAVAFEPEERLFRLLRANAILNGVDDRLSCVNTAIGEAAGRARLTMSDGNTGDYRLAGRQFSDDCMGEDARTSQEVSVRALDEFIDEFVPGSTLIYMDIQGYEGLALKGASELIAAAPPLVIEFWPYGMKRLESYEALCENLCSAPYSRFANLAEKEPSFQPFSKMTLDALYQQLGEGAEQFTDLLLLPA